MSAPEDSRGESVLTAGLTTVALGFVIARQALLDGRHAENAGYALRAAEAFVHAADTIGGLSETSPAGELTRAAALAGLTRVSGDEEMREAAVAGFEVVSEDELAAADLADWASLLSGDDPRSQELYLAATRAGGAPPWAYQAVGLDALRNGDGERAVANLQRAVLGEPWNPRTHVALGDALELAGRTPPAASAFMTAAVLMAMSGDDATATLYALRACELNRGSAVARLVYGDLLRARGERHEATRCLREIADAPDTPSAVAVVATRALARMFADDGRRQDAVTALSSLVEQESADAADLLLLGHLQVTLGHFQQAEDAYLRSIAADRDSVDGVYALVRHHLLYNGLDQARGVVDDALNESDRNAPLYVLRGELRRRAGDSGAPEDDIERARLLGLDPGPAWMMVGTIRLDDGDRTGALDAYKRALELVPDVAEWHARRGELALELGDVDLAVDELEQAARLDPTEPGIQLQLADARLAAGDGSNALAAVDAAIEIADHLSPFLLGLRGRVKRALNHRGAAVADLSDSVRADPWLGWPAAELLATLAETGSEGAAVEEVLRMLLQFGDARAVVATTAVLRQNERFQAVVTLVTRFLGGDAAAAASARDRSALLAHRGFAHFELDDLDSAATDLHTAIELDPYQAEAHVHHAIVIAQRERIDDAIASVRQARTLDPGSASVAYWAGRVISLSDVATALAELDAAIAQIGPEPDLLALRARLLIDAHQPEDALEVADSLKGARVDYEDLNRIKGLALAATGDHESAVPLLSAVVSQDANDSKAGLELARSLIALERYADALEVLQALNPDDPLSADVQALRGLAYRALGKRQAARDAFRTSITLDSSHPWSRQELVQAAWELGDIEEAREHLAALLREPAVARDPDVARLVWLLGDAVAADARLEDILEADPANADALRLRSALFLERGDVDAAIDTARHAVELDDASDKRLALADAYLAAGRPADALVALGTSAERGVELKRAEVQFALGHPGAAVETVDRLLGGTMPERDVSSLAQVVDLLTWGDQQERAVSVLLSALALSPQVDALRAAGTFLSSIGQFERAVAILEQARAVDPYERAVDAQLSWAYSKMPDAPLDKLLAASERSLYQNPEDPWLIKAKADALLLRGDPAAGPHYDRVLERLSTVSAPRDRHSLAAWCYYRKGELDRAVDHLLHATSIPSIRATGDRLDLGLALLAADRPALARREYELALTELRDQAGPLRRHGLLRVGLIDLDEAIARLPSVAALPGVGEIRGTVVNEVDACRVAFASIQPCLARIDELSNQLRQPVAGAAP